MMLGPPSAQSVHESVPCSSNDSALDEAALLKAWDGDIRRAATAGAGRLRGGVVDADDLAQAARCVLVQAFRRHRITSPHYIRRLIRNAILSVCRLEARRPDRDLSRRVELTDEFPALRPEPPDDWAAGVTIWVPTLPDRLQRIYVALYARRLTQRDAARQLGISQPRVAQLHAMILEQGRRALLPIAA